MAVLELTSKRNGRIEMLVNSCIKSLDRIGMNSFRNQCGAWPWDEGGGIIRKSS